MYITEAKFQREQNNFDALRLLAAFMVFITHSYGFPIDPISRLTGRTYTLSSFGLIIFFTLSGFLVCRSISRSSLKDYFWNRFLRICPALAVCSLLMVIIPGCIFTTLPLGEFLLHPGTWHFLLQNSFPVQVVFKLPGVFNGRAVNVSLWTIPLEIKFYIALALLPLTRVLSRRLLVLASWGLLVTITFTIKNKADLTGIRTLSTTLFYATYFFGGVVFFLFKEKIPVRFGIWLLLATGWLLAWKFSRSFFPFTAFLFFIFTIVGVGVSKIHLPFPHADISYGFYIYSYPVQRSIYYAWGDDLSFWQYFLTTLVITLLLATASWFLVEKKALSLKKHRSVTPVEELIAQPENKANQYK
jgi:peptidoglycan/LPS O-acetylase OafA/YrhL